MVGVLTEKIEINISRVRFILDSGSSVSLIGPFERDKIR